MLHYNNIFLSKDIPEDARKWRNSKDIWQWCRQNTLIGKKSQEQWLEHIEKDKSIEMFGIYDIKNYPVGVCGLTDIDLIHRNAEWSLYIAPEHQGKGYAKNALKALIMHGFDNLNLERIWGEMFEPNIRVQKIADDLGFKYEGYLRNTYYKGGQYINSIICSLIKEDYGLIKIQWIKDKEYKFINEKPTLGCE